SWPERRCAKPKKGEALPKGPSEAPGPAHPTGDRAAMITLAPPVPTRPGDVITLAPNVLSMRHWDRLLGGALYAATPRVPWADAPSAAGDLACSASSSSVSPCGASSRTSACPPRPRHPPERATRPRTWTSSSPPASSTSGWRREMGPRGGGPSPEGPGEGGVRLGRAQLGTRSSASGPGGASSGRYVNARCTRGHLDRAGAFGLPALKTSFRLARRRWVRAVRRSRVP